MTTLKDVAVRAKLSPSTVSRVLNSDKAFPDSTRKRVWNAAKELDYQPDQAARGLRLKATGHARRRTGLIAYVFNAGDCSSYAELAASCHSRRSFLMGLEAAKRGLFALSASYVCDDWSFVCKPALDGLIDGAIVGTGHVDLISTLKKYVPVVLMDVPFSPQTFGTPVVNVNQRAGLWMIAKKLYESGHRKLGIVEILNDALFGPARLTYFREAAAHYGLEIYYGPELQCRPAPDTHDSVMLSVAEKAASLIAGRKITALVCTHDVYAASIMKNLTELGIPVPEKCSVTGFESGILNRTRDNPVITSVAYPWARLVSKALDSLVRRIDEPLMDSDEILVEPELVDGETCARITME